jgi:hypothetical protein
MKSANCKVRSGFTGLEIVFVLILLGSVMASVRSCVDQTFSGGQKPVAPDPFSGAAVVVKDAAKAGAAVQGLSKADEAADPAAATPAVDPPVDPPTVDPDFGDGLDGLDVLFDFL